MGKIGFELGKGNWKFSFVIDFATLQCSEHRGVDNPSKVSDLPFF